MSLAHVSPSLPIEVVAYGRGVLGLCACPGVGAGLEADLAAMAAFRADVIVTLMSTQELKGLGRADLIDRLPLLAGQWHHTPLRAGVTPGAKFERLWAYTGWQARQALQRGGRVLIHCDDGRVRARWLATRLLGELGVRPDEVRAHIRLPRLDLVPPAGGAPPATVAAATDVLAGRILGCLMGGALGDGFGYAVEFKTLAEIREKHGAGGLVEPRLRDGELVASDDTQMTLFTAEGLLAATPAGATPSESAIVARIREAYLAWFRTQREDWPPRATGLGQHRVLWAVRAPAGACLAALKAGARGTPDAPANDAKCSGAVMRVAPLGLVPAIDADAAFRLGDAVAALTHGHPSGRLSAAAFASLLRDLLGETPLHEALERMEARLDGAPGGAETLASVRAARALAADGAAPETAIPALGQGWDGHEALAIALYAVLRAGSFADALRLAANHDGDSDTTASLAGQLWGVTHGLGDLPHDWSRRLDVFEPVCDMAGRLVTAAARPR